MRRMALTIKESVSDWNIDPKPIDGNIYGDDHLAITIKLNDIEAAVIAQALKTSISYFTTIAELQHHTSNLPPDTPIGFQPHIYPKWKMDEMVKRFKFFNTYFLQEEAISTQ